MLTPFICGSFHDQEQEDQDFDQWSLPATPKRSSKCCKSKGPRNPYSDRGLDKFTALLADLDKKRQKIYTQKGSEDISFVRFVYNNPNDCKPIIVKVRDHNNHNNHNNKQEKGVLDINKDNLNMPKLEEVDQEHEKHEVESDKNVMKWVNWRKPSFYLPLFIIFILLFLAMFGRSFTILCTSIAWYLLPTINDRDITTSLNSKTNLKKNSKKPKEKEYSRRFSNVRVASSQSTISSPKTNNTTSSPREHGHRKSW